MTNYAQLFMTLCITSLRDYPDLVLPMGIAIKDVTTIYVLDRGVIKLLDSAGNVTGTLPNSPALLKAPTGLSLGADGGLYVADTGNDRVVRIDASGGIVQEWGGPGELDEPTGVAVDPDGNVYIADRNNRIQKYGPDGTFLTAVGGPGTNPGAFSRSSAIALDTDGSIYVSDANNNRIQKFKLTTTVTNSKAIIVAAGGPFPGNNLWDTTQYSANFAYRTLIYQGFSKQSIWYLSSDIDLDLDQNGLPDDVDGQATKSNLEAAVTQWSTDADSLVIYLVDHGGDGVFRLSGTETLSADELAAWLDIAQAGKGPRAVVVVYDACQSGSFVPSLSRPGRIVITSAAADESAYFLSTGTISFSNFFWTNVLNGANILEAFSLAKEAISQTIQFQTPQLDDPSGLAASTSLGNGTQIQGDRPEVVVVSPDQSAESSTAPLFADVRDRDGIARVWAVIRPPDFTVTDPSNPVQNLPSVDLQPVDLEPVPDTVQRWDGSYADFTSKGTYQIAVYARDRVGNTSLPKLTTVSVDNPLRRRGILLACGTQGDALWPATENALRTAYAALQRQGYRDDEINDDLYVMSPTSIVEGQTVLPTLSYLESALTTWPGSDTQDLVLYMIGPGDSGVFTLNAEETLSAATLDGWLDTLQATLPGKVTVIYDAARSGSFLSALTPPNGKQRIVLASAAADEAAAFLSSGDVSFSNFFWRRILNGSDVGRAFSHAAVAMKFAAGNQQGQIDDNGNGIAN